MTSKKLAYIRRRGSVAEAGKSVKQSALRAPSSALGGEKSGSFLSSARRARGVAVSDKGARKVLLNWAQLLFPLKCHTLLSREDEGGLPASRTPLCSRLSGRRHSLQKARRRVKRAGDRRLSAWRSYGLTGGTECTEHGALVLCAHTVQAVYSE